MFDHFRKQTQREIVSKRLQQLKAYRLQLQTLGYIYDQGVQSREYVAAVVNRWINQAGKVPARETKRETAYNRACLHYYRGKWDTLADRLEAAKKGPCGLSDPYKAAFRRILKREAANNVEK